MKTLFTAVIVAAALGLGPAAAQEKQEMPMKGPMTKEYDEERRNERYVRHDWRYVGHDETDVRAHGRGNETNEVSSFRRRDYHACPA
jgi:hypothetical protein